MNQRTEITHNVTPEDYMQIYQTKNPFDRDIKIRRAYGFSDLIVKNAEKVLCIITP
jgi:hypothetical protein